MTCPECERAKDPLANLPQRASAWKTFQSHVAGMVNTVMHDLPREPKRSFIAGSRIRFARLEDQSAIDLTALIMYDRARENVWGVVPQGPSAHYGLLPGAWPTAEGRAAVLRLAGLPT